MKLNDGWSTIYTFTLHLLAIASCIFNAHSWRAVSCIYLMALVINHCDNTYMFVIIIIIIRKASIAITVLHTIVVHFEEVQSQSLDNKDSSGELTNA